MARRIEYQAVDVHTVQHYVGRGFVQDIRIFLEGSQHQVVDLFRVRIQGQSQLDLYPAQGTGVGDIAHDLGDEF